MIGTPNHGSTNAFLIWNKVNIIPKALYAIPGSQLFPTYSYIYDYESKRMNQELQQAFRNNFLIGLNNTILNPRSRYYSIFNISRKTPSLVYVTSSNNKLTIKEIIDGDGDDTVLATSAELPGPTPLPIDEPSGSHSILPGNSAVKNKVLAILQSDNDS